jgi:hypothetical protein
MKTYLVLALSLSLCSGFNLADCQADLKGLFISYAHAVLDWNSVINFRQAIQETGYAVQFLGNALIDCDPLPSGLFSPATLQEAGEQLIHYSDSLEFDPLINFASDSTCEEKLEVLIENAQYFLKTKQGHSFILQSLHDFMLTCHQDFESYF